MIKRYLQATAVGTALLVAMPAFAQSNATQSTTGTGSIIRAITLAKNSDIAFGRVVRPSAGTSTVTINETNGARSLSGGDGVLLSGAAGRATYTIGGEGAQAFSITVPATFEMTRAGGSDTITVNLSSSAVNGTLTGSLGASGASTFGVGGNFGVTNSTPTGAYSGTFNVTVQYD